MKGIHLKSEHDVVSYIELNLNPAQKVILAALSSDSYKYLGKHDNMLYGDTTCHGWILEVTSLINKQVSYVGVYVKDDDHRERFISIRNKAPENYYVNATDTKPEAPGHGTENTTC